MNTIHFHSEEIDFKLHHQKKISDWIRTAIHDHEFNLSELNFIFCSDVYLLEINQNYLGHDYYTDIVTFDNSEEDKTIEGDVFISIDRVNENAVELHSDFVYELHRVIIHGVLHLLGHKDGSKEEKFRMRKLEDHYLALRNFEIN